MNFISGLTGVRALAALAVVIYHLNQRIPTLGMGGGTWNIHQFIGHFSVMVSVFFMLSAFFRSLSYWKNTDTPEKIPAFWPSLKDRWLRIAPAYYVVLFISLITTYFVYGFSGMNMPAFFSGFAFLTWISPDTLFPVLLNGPLWFISFDMIGWIGTSLFMMGWFHLDKKHRVCYAIFITLLTLGLHFLWIHLPWSHTDGIASVWFPIYNPFLFFLHFLFGIAAAGIVNFLIKRNQKISAWFDVGTLVVGLIAFISVWMIRDLGDWVSWPTGPYHFPWLTTLILLTFVFLPFTRYLGKILDNRFFVFTAKISFSLFLIHGVIMEILRVFVFPSPLTLHTWILYAILTLILSYLFAWFLYRFVEFPCIPKKNK